MASTLTTSMIAALTPYWYARVPVVTTVSLAAGTTANVLGPLTNWNPGPSPTTLVTLNAVRAAQDPGVTLQAQADRTSLQLYTTSQPPGYAPVRVGLPAAQSLSVTAQNLTTTASQLSPVLLDLSVFRLPIAWKILLNLPLSPTDEATAAAIGLDTAAVAQNGQFPIPLPAVIERTYLNRAYAASLAYDGPPILGQGALTATLPTFIVPDNAVWVLRRIVVPIDADYVPLVTLNWENQDSFWQGNPAQVPGGLDFFLPFLQQLQVQVTVQTPTPGPIPVRIEVDQLVLSNILRVRLGLLTDAGLASVYQSVITAQAAAAGTTPNPAALAKATENATTFVQRVAAGVM
jgi:hypothetical protein